MPSLQVIFVQGRFLLQALVLSLLFACPEGQYNIMDYCPLKAHSDLIYCFVLEYCNTECN